MDGIDIARHLLSTHNQLPIYMKQLCRQCTLLRAATWRNRVLLSESKVLKNENLCYSQVFCMMPRENLFIKKEMQKLTDDRNWLHGKLHHVSAREWLLAWREATGRVPHLTELM